MSGVNYSLLIKQTACQVTQLAIQSILNKTRQTVLTMPHLIELSRAITNHFVTALTLGKIVVLVVSGQKY